MCHLWKLLQSKSWVLITRKTIVYFFNAVSIWDERSDLLWSSFHDVSLCCPPWTSTVLPVNYISIKLEGKHFWSIRSLPETMPLLTKKCLLEENNPWIQHADTSRETLLVCGLPSCPWQVWMVWSRKGDPQSWTSSEPVRKIGSSLQRKPVLFTSEGSRVHPPVLFSVL